MSPHEIFGKALTLGIDTSTAQSSVCVAEGRDILATEATEELGSAEALTKLIDSVCTKAHRALRDCGLIAVCLGPGSFTGLRTGLASSFGLALGLDLPVRGISAFAARLFTALNGPGSYLVHLRASREEMFWTVLSAEEMSDGWLIKTLAPPLATRCESFDADSARKLTELGVSALRIDADKLGESTPGAHGVALAAQFCSGESPEFQQGSAIAGLAPLYIKPPNAKTLAERGVGAANNC